MWTGSPTNVPDGWTLCDGNDPRSGSSSVPDLRNRFVTGAGDQYSVGNTGGEKQVQLTVDEVPSHTHSYQNAEGTVEAPDYNEIGSLREQADAGQTTGSTGGDQAHENRPPYYALAYIMKL